MNKICLLVLIMLFGLELIGQDNSGKFITPADTFNTKRFYSATAFAGGTYTAFSIGLYNVWYKQYEQTEFHFFDDWQEWNNMDKYGHFYTSYFQGVLCYKGARWTGLNKKKSILAGAILGSLFQTTIEIMDGYSAKWGFSNYDLAYNLAGTGIFALQQSIWDEQRIQFKVSSYKRNYDNLIISSANGIEETSLESRADYLFGSSFPERFLKDYNAQTLWASVNVRSFLPDQYRFPKWLNIAVGTGSENMFGGFENRWQGEQSTFELKMDQYPRYRQFFIGLDIDLTRLGINNYYWNSLLSVFNIFKIPGPAIEINTLGEVKFHLIHF